MKTYSFKVVVEPDEDAPGNPAWHVYCPVLEGIGDATSGRTRDEALRLPTLSQEAPRIAVTV